MEFKNFKQLDRALSTEVKILVPLTLILLVFSYWYRDLKDTLFVASLCTLLFVILIDYFIIIPHKFPNVWKMIKWLSLAMIILLTLIG